MKDNRVLKVLWGIVLAIFLCSALFIGISYFSGGDSSSKKKSEDTTTTSSSKTKDKEKNIERIRNPMEKKAHLLRMLLGQKTTDQVIPIGF